MTPSRAWVPGGAVLCAAALVLGLLSKPDPGALSLVWPVSGVATVWLLGAGARVRLVLGLLLLVCAATNLGSGVSLPGSLAFGVVNALHAVAAVAVLRQRGWTRPRPLARVRDLQDLVLAAVAGGLLSAPGAALVARWEWGSDPLAMLVPTLTRNSVSTLVVAALLLALLGLRGTPDAARGAARPPERWVGSALALAVTWAVVQVDDVPLAFLALSATVWAGTRLGPARATVLLAGQGVLVVLQALTGTGAFAAGTPFVSALLAQTLLAVLTVVGLWLALVETERQSAQARLSHLALHDELTGLPNRALWRDRAERALAAGARGGERTGLLSVDLDRFKAVNDQHGHEVGDLLLAEVGRRLSAAVRPQDTVARIGGDEFLVLLPGVPDERRLEEVGRRLLAAVGPVVRLGDLQLPVTATVGGTLPATAEEAAALGVPGLLRQADAALLTAKRAGRARFVRHAEDGADSGDGLLPELRLALAAGQLVAHYQPVVDLASGRAVGLEALVRWEHPQRGVLAPSAFLDVLEASDLIHPLGQLVLEQACRDAAALHEEGRPLHVHVNVSAAELDRPGLVDRVAAALGAAGLPAALLTLELTETRLLTIEGTLLRELEAVRALGVRLAVDDFGTGYSALAHLVQMPVDVLKLDRSFVAGLGRSRSARAVTHGVIAMAQALDVECVAEGVEDAAQAQELLRLGYDVGQGWQWSRALPLSELRRWLARGDVRLPVQTPATR